MNKPAQRAQRIAERRRRNRRTLQGIASALLGAILFLSGYFWPRPLPLPPTYDPVMVRTSSRWHLGYLDEAGDFRQVWTGERIGQVIEWKRP